MVIEVEAIKFKKFHHQHTQVARRIDLSPPYLRMHLQKAHSQADDAVAPQTACEDLVHGPLAEKCLGDKYEGSKSGQFGQKSRHHSSHFYSILLVDRNIDGEVAVFGNKFDDGYFCLGDDSHFIGYPCAFERVSKRM